MSRPIRRLPALALALFAGVTASCGEFTGPRSPTLRVRSLADDVAGVFRAGDEVVILEATGRIRGLEAVSGEPGAPIAHAAPPGAAPRMCRRSAGTWLLTWVGGPVLEVRAGSTRTVRPPGAELIRLRAAGLLLCGDTLVPASAEPAWRLEDVLAVSTGGEVLVACRADGALQEVDPTTGTVRRLGRLPAPDVIEHLQAFPGEWLLVQWRRLRSYREGEPAQSEMALEGYRRGHRQWSYRFLEDEDGRVDLDLHADDHGILALTSVPTPGDEPAAGLDHHLHRLEPDGRVVESWRLPAPSGAHPARLLAVGSEQIWLEVGPEVLLARRSPMTLLARVRSGRSPIEAAAIHGEALLVVQGGELRVLLGPPAEEANRPATSRAATGASP